MNSPRRRFTLERRPGPDGARYRLGMDRTGVRLLADEQQLRALVALIQQEIDC